MPDQTVPAVVLELASRVGGVPLSWRIEPLCVVIVMRDGRKLEFDKDGADEETQEVRAEIKIERNEKKKK